MYELCMVKSLHIFFFFLEKINKIRKHSDHRANVLEYS